MQGKRRIYGGLADMRIALYMATLSAVRWEPVLRAHYTQLRARGKIAKVALVAKVQKAQPEPPVSTGRRQPHQPVSNLRVFIAALGKVAVAGLPQLER